MTERHLFSELTEGFDALANTRAGKRTLRTHEIERKPEASSTAEELKAIQEKLNLPKETAAKPHSPRDATAASFAYSPSQEAK